MSKKLATLLAVFATATFSMTGMALANTGDDGYGAADAGSLGVTEATTLDDYCAADAGSLGLPNPAEVC